MSGIRVTYTGLISLIGGIISIFTGIIFTLIITRSVTPEEYGTWGLIIGLITYVTLIGPIVSYWSTRDTVRNIQSGKTAILSSLLLSIGAISTYIIISTAFLKSDMLIIFSSDSDLVTTFGSE